MSTDTAPLDVQRLILEQLREITAEVRLIPQILARLDAMATEQKRLEQRDADQQRQIDDNKVRASELAASLSILSSELHDLRRRQDACPALKELEALDALKERMSHAEHTLNGISKIGAAGGLSILGLIIERLASIM